MLCVKFNCTHECTQACMHLYACIHNELIDLDILQLHGSIWYSVGQMSYYVHACADSFVVAS